MLQTCRLLLIGLALYLGMILSTPSLGQIDPDPDGLGVYFDTAATQVTASAEAGTNLQAYLVGTHLSVPGDIGYWQAKVCPGGTNGMAMISGTPYGGFNFSMNMPGDGCWGCVTFGLEPALPTQEITLLASLDVQVWDDFPAGIVLDWEGGYYQVVGSDEMIPFHPSSGDLNLPVATVNAAAPVATRADTWDSIKATYR